MFIQLTLQLKRRISKHCLIMSDFSEFAKNPLLFTRLEENNKERDTLIDLICETSESPEQMKALLICRQALEADTITGQLSDEQTYLLNTIWQRFVSPDHGISNLLSCCFLVDRLILCPAITAQLKSNVKIVNFLQTHLLAEGLNRKYVYHILRSIRDPEKCAAWQSFFVIFDTLAEKQSHLIIPVLELLGKTRSLPDQWHYTLLAHALTISNNPVIRKVIHFILQKPQLVEGNLFNGTITYYERFLNSLNTNFLYADDDSLMSSWLRSYFEQSSADLLDRQLNIIYTINWKSVPLLYLCESLIDVVEPANLPHCTKLAQQIPNCMLRWLILTKLSRSVIFDDKDALWFKERLQNNSYETQKRDLLAVSSLRTETDNKPSLVSESLLNIISSSVNTLVNKYYSDLGPTDPSIIQNISQNLVHTFDWLQPLERPSVDRLLQDIGLSKIGFFERELSIITASILIHRFSSVDWSSRFVTALIDYELQMGLQVLAANAVRVPIDDRADILERCFAEVQSPKNMHLIVSFILVLDALVHHDPSFEDEQRMYYDKIVRMAPLHPKWMVLLSSHQEVWQVAANDTSFMVSALSFGQALKGDQLYVFN